MVIDRQVISDMIILSSIKGDIQMNQQAFNEMGELREAVKKYEWAGEFLKAALIHQLYIELYLRSNGLPVGEYWKL